MNPRLDIPFGNVEIDDDDDNNDDDTENIEDKYSEACLQ